MATKGEMKFVSRKAGKSNLEMDAFLARAVACKIPVEIVNLNPGDLVSLPESVFGKTTINYTGNAPLAAREYDQYGNVQIFSRANSAFEVIFNSEKVGAVGRNRGAHGKKIIYLVN